MEHSLFVAPLAHFSYVTFCTFFEKRGGHDVCTNVLVGSLEVESSGFLMNFRRRKSPPVRAGVCFHNRCVMQPYADRLFEPVVQRIVLACFAIAFVF